MYHTQVWSVFFFFKVTFLTHIHHITKIKVTLYLHNIYKYAIIFVFIENNNVEKLFSFLYSDPIFRILKMKIEYKY